MWTLKLANTLGPKPLNPVPPPPGSDDWKQVSSRNESPGRAYFDKRVHSNEPYRCRYFGTRGGHKFCSFGGQRTTYFAVEDCNIEHSGQQTFCRSDLQDRNIHTHKTCERDVGKSREAAPTLVVSGLHGVETGSSVKASSPYSCDSIKPISQ